MSKKKGFLTNGERMLKFVELTHAFQQVKRKILVTGENRLEHNLEHSAQLEWVATYIVCTENTNLDLILVQWYCKVHDLSELYGARDVSVYTDPVELVRGKEERERLAVRKLLQEFTEFKQLRQYISEYRQKKCPEARFVYALDKLLPMWNIFLDEGRSWHSFNVTIDRMRKAKESKIKRCPIVWAKYQQLLVELRRRQGDLFAVPRRGRKKKLVIETKIIPLATAA
jgi:5'-deoxynucleotidase YfbR-like HD superfamily hydrolase